MAARSIIGIRGTHAVHTRDVDFTSYGGPFGDSLGDPLGDLLGGVFGDVPLVFCIS